MTSRRDEARIVCPKCRAPIKLTESLAAPILERARKKLQGHLASKQSDLTKREATLRQAQTSLQNARKSIDDEIATKVNAQKSKISLAEFKKAQMLLAADLRARDRQLADLETLLSANNLKLAEAQIAQSEMIRKSRELDDAKREVELSVQKRVQSELDDARTQAKAEAESHLISKVTEKEIQISGMQRQIDDLRRRSQQGSQQLQGEALEVELEATLRHRFPADEFQAVRIGSSGADILQTVVSRGGLRCGTIVWEAKAANNWNNSWLAKLRDDLRAANGSVGVLVSKTAPKELETFELMDGIWVARPRYALPLAIVLRESLVELTASRQASAGQRTKMELIYSYLTGPKFRQRMEAIVERFTEMQSDLDRERRAMTRLWTKREEQLRCVLDSSAGLYGELQGIAGGSILSVEGLEPLAITDGLGKQ